MSSDSLLELSSLACSHDVSGLEEAALQTLLGDARTVQRRLDGLIMRIGVRANQLAAQGRSAPAEETVRGAGTVGSRTARREAARANAAQQVAGLGPAASTGEASGEHVDVIARYLAKLSEAERQAVDFEALVQKAKDLSPESFDRLVKRTVDQAKKDHGLGETKAKQAASEFRHWFDHDAGMGRFSGSLDPERYEALTDAIEQHMASVAASSSSPIAKTRNLAASALVELVLSAGGRAARNRLPSVTVIVDHATVVAGPHEYSVRQTAAGHDVSAASVARLCCDATIRRVTTDSMGVPINVGRKYRTATDAQWAAIKTVHASCAWDGCDAPIGWCQAHHIREWDHGGPTDLDNLVPLCSRHHHRVHEGQWQLKMLPDRSLEICKPNGSHHATVSPPRRC